MSAHSGSGYSRLYGFQTKMYYVVLVVNVKHANIVKGCKRSGFSGYIYFRRNVETEIILIKQVWLFGYSIFR